jgi:hypothetical protein
MRNIIVIEVDNVFLTDFDSTLSAPALIESKDGGVRMLFGDIEELINYKETIFPDKDTAEETIPQHANVKSKLSLPIYQALRDNQVVLDAIKSFAHTLFSFVFDADAHRQDKIDIFNNLVEAITETTNSWELEKAIHESTYELGVLIFNHKITFYNYAHNQVDFDYEKIKNRLIKDLLLLKFK